MSTIDASSIFVLLSFKVVVLCSLEALFFDEFFSTLLLLHQQWQVTWLGLDCNYF
jgi:hypothetical protein